jgi:hypothetical protein
VSIPFFAHGDERNNPGELIDPQSMSRVELAVSEDRLVVPIMQVSGNIWVLENVDR